MEELIKLREYCELEKEKATKAKNIEVENKRGWAVSNYMGQELAFSGIIEYCDLILNNSVVKPSERRSPTDESFSGCKPPERKAKSTEENLECKCSPNQMCSNCVSKFSHIC